MRNQEPTTKELIRALKLSAKESNSISLSKKKKKEILASILPEKRNWLVLSWQFAVPAVSMMLAVFMVLTYTSKPGTALYSVREGIDNTKNTVSRSVGDALGISKTEDNSTTATEDSNSQSSSDDTQPDDSNGTAPDGSSSTTSDDTQPDDSNGTAPDGSSSTTSDDSTKTTSGGSTTTEGTTSNTHNTSARDDCRAKLDARKANGENISSDQYKQCG